MASRMSGRRNGGVIGGVGVAGVAHLDGPGATTTGGALLPPSSSSSSPFLQSQLPKYYSSSTSSLFGLGTTSLTGGGGGTASSSVSSLSRTHNQQQHHHHHPHSPSSPPHLPSLRAIITELFLICSLKCRYTIQSLRKPCQRFNRRVFYCLASVLAGVLVLLAWLTLDFYMDAVDICTPPPGYNHDMTRFDSFLAQMDAMNNIASAGAPSVVVGSELQQEHAHRSSNTTGTYKSPNGNNQFEDDDEEEQRPLVEYYVHGRGIGHYARSVAIVEQLNLAGIDVRLFLTRSAMWRAMHEDSKMVDGGYHDVDNDKMTEEDAGIIDRSTTSTGGHKSSVLHPTNKHRGRTTAISIASLTPDQSVFDVISHVIDRVSGDCEVAATSGRYPQLVISDGDFPGMLRAEFGGIPSVGIAHGQLFSIAQKPSWVQSVPILNRAWNKQGRLNYVSGLFTEWQIATHFCFLESRYSSGTVARAPLRPEVLEMAEARKAARNGSFDPNQLPQQSRIRKLLLHDLRHHDDKTLTEARLSITQTGPSIVSVPRKMVICYFRDHNGEIVVQALLDAGFDLLLFDTGYYRDMQQDPNRYGVKWIVRDRDETRTMHTRGEQQLRHRRLLLEDEKSQTERKNATFSTPPILHRRLVGKSGPRLIRITDRSLFVPLMHIADGVASSAGSQLMSECIYSHMPLLALYKEVDDEQRLNVELSHHTDAPCHRPLVFGTSFEGLTTGLRKNTTSYGEPPSDQLGRTLDAFNKFVQEVRASPTSDAYYRSLFNETSSSSSSWHTNSDMARTSPSAVDGMDLEKDPFQGLPDAAAIILEIVKQVVQK
jgi:hypothetical protein